MASPEYIKWREAERRKKEEERLRTEAKAKVAKEWLGWNDRRKAAEASGEPFVEPHPYGEEWKRRRREARQSTKLYRLQHHWIWPHLMILFVVCLVIDIVALGFGLVWLVKYVASIEGSGKVALIAAGSLFAIIVYCILWAGFTKRHEPED